MSTKYYLDKFENRQSEQLQQIQSDLNIIKAAILSRDKKMNDQSEVGKLVESEHNGVTQGPCKVFHPKCSNCTSINYFHSTNNHNI